MRRIFVNFKPIMVLIVLFLLISGTAFGDAGFYGYIQTNMIKTETNKAFTFGFERVRIGSKGTLNQYVDYRLLFDLVSSAETSGNDGGESPAIINNAEVIFKLTPKLKLTAGKYKTPIGMEWNVPATNLDVIKRGLGQAFVFHFDTGLMLYGDKIGKPGLGFALGVFNAGPNKANNVGDPALGQDYTVTGRISIDPGKTFHAQAYLGSALTSVSGQENVNVFGGAVIFKPATPLTLKGEFMSRSDAQNLSSDGNDYYLQAGYFVHPNFEPLIKFESLNVSNDAKDQANLTLGLNTYFNKENLKQSKVQVNYIISDMDGKNDLQVLYQVAF
jgi:hypothetical protein